MKQPKYIDFHMHTRYSDGELTPQNLVQVMAARGLNIIAITDHDNFRQYADAKPVAERYGVTLIPGTEVTTPHYHLLGFGFDPQDQKIQEFLDYASRTQEQGVARKVAVLQEHGIPITLEKMHAEYPLARIGKGNLKATLLSDPDCRRVIQEKHPSFGPNEVFEYYLGKQGVANRTWPKDAVDPKEAIAAIHASGGIIGIAHAPRDVVYKGELEDLIGLGLDFLEIQPFGKSLAPKGSITYQTVEEVAKEKELPLSFGSDYHGPNFNRPLLGRTENTLSDGLASLLNNCSGVREKV